MPSVHVAVGIIFNSLGKVLVALRPDHKLQGGFWEFPGGKVEQGETVVQALARELMEEVGIQVEAAQSLIQCWHHYQDQHVWLDVWHVNQFIGEAHGREGQEIAWVTLEELRSLPLLSANHPIVEALNSL